MIVTPVGFVFLIAGLAAIFRPFSIGLLVLAIAIPLETAAAVNIPALGYSSVMAAFVVIGAILTAIALRPNLFASYGSFIFSFRPFLLFLAFTIYAVLSAWLMPRLFAGDITVVSLSRVDALANTGFPALRPSAGNITQSAYLLGELALLSILLFAFCRAGGLVLAARVMNTITVVFLGFGALSLFQGIGAVDAVLEFVRTANYAIHSHQSMLGFTRVNGASSEPSVFGAAAATLFVYNAIRYSQTRGVWFGAASMALLLAVAASLSTTGYAVLLIMAALWGVRTFGLLIVKGLRRDDLVGLFTSALLAAACIALLLLEPLQQIALNLVASLFGEKLTSQSGVERMLWNAMGVENLFASYGLGVGFGSAKTSSHLITVLSNVGIVGAGLYAAFLASSIIRSWPYAASGAGMGASWEAAEPIVARRYFFAARGAAIAQLAGLTVSGTLARPGPLLIVLCAISMAAIVSVALPSRGGRGVLDIAVPVAARGPVPASARG